MTTLATFENLNKKLTTTTTRNEPFHASYYQTSDDDDGGGNSGNGYNGFNKITPPTRKKIAKDDASLLQKTSTTLQKLHKSHSYSETLRPKVTNSKQDTLNGHIATSQYVDSKESELRFQRVTASMPASAFIIPRDTTNSDLYCLKSNNNNNNYNYNDDVDIDDDDSDVVFINTIKTTALNVEMVNGDEEDDDSAGAGIGISINEAESEDACLLLPADSHSLSASAATKSPNRRAAIGAAANNNARRSNSRATSSSSACYRLHALITRNWYLNYLVPLSILLALMLVAYLTRDYAKRLLYWIETQNSWIVFAIFILLFIIVSFPIIVGYFVLMITAGYLFGFFKGILTVILGANVGIALAHICIRSMRHRIPMHRLIKNETGRAILRVISGPRAFRVVLFTRLTPIPFGLQNAIFGVSSINPRIYHAATFLGLLPAQTINVYLGSTLRSMHEVLNSHGTAVTGYISFGIEVVCGVALMFWVVQKARKELSETLLDCSSSESKIINIQV